jgi:hypothetical protein
MPEFVGFASGKVMEVNELTNHPFNTPPDFKSL